MIKMSEVEVIRRLIETGKVSMGTRSVEKLLKTGKPKLIIVTENCPKQTKENVKHYANIAGVPVYEFKGTSLQLGELCRKPFPVSAMAVIDPGQAEITKLRSSK